MPKKSRRRNSRANAGLNGFFWLFILALFSPPHNVVAEQRHFRSAPQTDEPSKYRQTANAPRFHRIVANSIASDNQKAVDGQVEGQNVYLSGADGKVFSLNLQSDKKNWESDLGGQIVSAPLSSGESLYVVGKTRDAVSLTKLSKTTGVTEAQTAVRQLAFDAKPFEKVFLYSFENLLVLLFDDGEIFFFANETGRIVGREKVPSKISAAPVQTTTNDQVFFGTADLRIWELSLRKKSLEALSELPSEPTFIAVGEEFSLVVGDRAGFLRFINRRDRSQTRRFRCGGSITNISRTSRGLLVTSADNFIYFLKRDAQRPVWKKRLAGRINGVPRFDEERVVVTTVEARSLPVLSLRNGQILDRITLQENFFFTGESLHTGNVLIYLTDGGVLSFILQTKNAAV